MHGKPERFLICEHSTIVTPEPLELMPRFCRWNLGTVAVKLKGIDLRAEGCIEVHCDKLVGTIRECHIVKHEPVLIDRTEGCQNVMDVDPVTEGGNVDPSFNCWQTDSADGGHVRTE
ncbi:hypothetical protein CsSME_00004572 [Camellia sinensis var. sinensis]